MIKMRVLVLVVSALVWFWCRFSLLASAQNNITHPLEVAALKAVRHALIDPYKRLKNWRKTDPCSSNWVGVICFNSSDHVDGYRHVQELRLLNMNFSGILSPQLGEFTHMTILNFMWNDISGSIPKEIGSMTSLKLLLLSGNQLSGPLPDELGNLLNITKFQLDINNLSGPIPKSFANLVTVVHFHMNNNSFSGQIPPELNKLQNLAHFLLDNNNLSGYLPPELSEMSMMKIFQVNNNNFSGTTIPESYTNMPKLMKLTLRNCNLEGNIPDFSTIPGLRYLDLSSNKFNGTIPTKKLSDNITTIDLSKNKLSGPIPTNFSTFPRLQRLSLEENRLSGMIPSTFWQNIVFKSDDMLRLDFRNNYISNISGTVIPNANVSIKLQENPVCENANALDIVRFCELDNGKGVLESPGNSSSEPSSSECKPQSCPASESFEYVLGSPIPCFCAIPIGVGMRLRSPSFSEFRPYIGVFERFITDNLGVDNYQLSIPSFYWQEGPRVWLAMKIFPSYINNSVNKFDDAELDRILTYFARFLFPSNDLFGPYDLLNFTLVGPYKSAIVAPSESSMNKGVLTGIILGALSCGITLLLAALYFFSKNRHISQEKNGKRQPSGNTSCKIEGVKGFNFTELDWATGGFGFDSQVGQGGYGRVYKGVLVDGTAVAVKRAQQGSLQGEREFYTEIEMLSRVHHRNLVTLVGYCDEEGEQMLVYEYMPNGSLHSLLSGSFRSSLSYAMRMQIALDSAKGVLYLHTDANPPIIHRDIKANNILLDSKFTAKVSDFGISKLAPVSENKDVMAHVSTVVKGTPGYLDPEYFLTRKLTEKSDVYSLGVVFLELLTGTPPIHHGKNIVREVVAACQSRKMLSVVDREMGSYNPECVKKFMILALKCCQEETKGRPSMLEVVRELEDFCSKLPRLETNRSDILNASSSRLITGSFGPSPQQLHYERNANNRGSSTDYVGSDLISGFFPDIKPR